MTTLSPLSAGPDRDLHYSAADFAAIAAYLHAQTGILLAPGSEQLVFSRLAKRVRQLGLAGFGAYLDLVRAPDSGDEREAMISALTTNTTRFFREPYHFDTLERILPELVDRAARGDRVRLWSAACSSGEEAYSIALCLAQACPEAARHDIRILATDIDRTVLARAARGRYPVEAVAALSPARRGAFREVAPGEVEVAPEIRALVTFRALNLVGPWPMRGPFQAIFCRNVAIYMDADTQLDIWRGIQRVIAPDGHVFIGHSERLPPELKDAFTLCGKTTYRPAAAPPVHRTPARGAPTPGAESWH